MFRVSITIFLVFETVDKTGSSSLGVSNHPRHELGSEHVPPGARVVSRFTGTPWVGLETALHRCTRSVSTSILTQSHHLELIKSSWFLQPLRAKRRPKNMAHRNCSSQELDGFEKLEGSSTQNFEWL